MSGLVTNSKNLVGVDSNSVCSGSRFRSVHLQAVVEKTLYFDPTPYNNTVLDSTSLSCSQPFFVMSVLCDRTTLDHDARIQSSHRWICKVNVLFLVNLIIINFVATDWIHIPLLYLLSHRSILVSEDVILSSSFVFFRLVYS
jgi:hypothetical protein